MKNKKWGIPALILVFAVIGVFYSVYFKETIPAFEDENEKQVVSMPEEKDSFEIQGIEDVKEPDESEEEKEADRMVCVHICGQVKEPGVYTLGQDDRVAKAVEAAGGFTEKAQESSVNLARKVEDGEQIYVLSKEESKESMAQGAFQTAGQGILNINLAEKEELMSLPGIGERKAEAILTYRSQHGKFKKIEDLTKIEGIKEGVFEKIKDKIKV